jgi:hypothetical protein
LTLYHVQGTRQIKVMESRKKLYWPAQTTRLDAGPTRVRDH